LVGFGGGTGGLYEVEEELDAAHVDSCQVFSGWSHAGHEVDAVAELPVYLSDAAYLGSGTWIWLTGLHLVFVLFFHTDSVIGELGVRQTAFLCAGGGGAGGLAVDEVVS